MKRLPRLPEPALLELRGRRADAAAAWHRLGSHYEAALALGRSPDVDDLREAHGRFLAMDAPGAAAKVSRQLRRRGADRVPRRPRRQTAANPAGLTDREADVLASLAQGFRNAQIAQRLVLSRRTVEHHVSAVMHKLGAHARAEAVALARERGLIPN